MSKYHYTIGMTATSSLLKKPVLAKVCMEDKGNGTIKLTVENCRNLAQIKKLGSVIITYDEYNNRPDDDNVAEARWAFGKFGLRIGGN